VAFAGDGRFEKAGPTPPVTVRVRRVARVEFPALPRYLVSTGGELEVKVTAGAGPPPTGKVELTLGGKEAGEAPLAGGAATFRLRPDALKPGREPLLVARYEGDDTCRAGTSAPARLPVVREVEGQLSKGKIQPLDRAADKLGKYVFDNPVEVVKCFPDQVNPDKEYRLCFRWDGEGKGRAGGAKVIAANMRRAAVGGAAVSGLLPPAARPWPALALARAAETVGGDAVTVSWAWADPRKCDKVVVEYSPASSRGARQFPWGTLELSKRPPQPRDGKPGGPEAGPYYLHLRLHHFTSRHTNAEASRGQLEEFKRVCEALDGCVAEVYDRAALDYDKADYETPEPTFKGAPRLKPGAVPHLREGAVPRLRVRFAR
jgi:hypothetical protein